MADPGWCPRCKTPQDVRRGHRIYLKHKDPRTGVRCDGSGEPRLRHKKRKSRVGSKRTSS